MHKVVAVGSTCAVCVRISFVGLQDFGPTLAHIRRQFVSTVGCIDENQQILQCQYPVAKILSFQRVIWIS